MADEKILPQDDSIHDDGPIPATREERIKLATERGGLKSCPSSFSNEYMDWETIKSDSPFEVLYLDYRAYDRISRAMIDSNLAVIKKFWTDTAAKAMSSPPVAKKYGGIDAIRRYPQILQKACAELTSNADAPRKFFEQHIGRKFESLRPSVESILKPGRFTSEIRQDVTAQGMEKHLTKDEVDSFLLGVLKEKGFTPEREVPNDQLSVCWYSSEEWDRIKQRENRELDSIIEGILADKVFEPSELSTIKEKGRKLGHTEEQTLTYFEQKLRSSGFSPDADANFSDTDTIHKKLSAIWRTNEKHLEVAISKFRTFLDGKLHNGIYNPADNVTITEAAPGYLKRDALKLKEILITYLKEKGFKPLSEFRPGHELGVSWKTDLASSDAFEEKLSALTVNTTPIGASLFLNGERKGTSPLTINNLKQGSYTVRVEMEGYKTKEENVTLDEESQALNIKLKKKGKPIFARIVAALIILAVGYFIYTNFIGKSQFISKIDRAIAERRYFSPAGNNVADFIRAKKTSAPNSPELQEAVSRIRQKLEPVGNDAFQRLYSDSIDSEWDNTVNIYKLLNEIIPDDRDIAAKAKFCQAHQIIKGKGKKNYFDALAQYQKALELKPNWVLAINGIAKVYVRKDSPYYNKEEALNWYNKASESDPNFPWAYTNIAAIYMEDKQWDMAEQALLNALKIKNNSASIFTELGKACEKQQRGQDAKNYYQEAMKYEKDSEKVAWLQKKISAIQ